jgi:hypothetical protein
MPLFRLKHPNPEFQGTAGGVDFSAGFGTTSALSYAHGLVKTLNCRAFVVINGGDREIEILEELNKGGAMVLSYRIHEQVKDGGAIESAPPPVPSQAKLKKPSGRHGGSKK